jgi:ABC-2 type transport system ATP-binding protein
VQTVHSDRETTLIVRMDGQILDPAWEQYDVGLEEVVLAYLRNSSAGSLPRPEMAVAERVR